MKFTKITNTSKTGTLKPYFPGWLQERFGDCFAQICTVATLKLKNAVKDVARSVLGQVPPEIEDWAKRFELPPQGLSDSKFILGWDDDEGHHQGSIERDQALQAYVTKYPQQWEIVKNALALPRQMGRHASAFIVASKPVSEFIPTATVSGVRVTAFSGTEVEAVGGLKMDWLVVKALRDLQSCMEMIRQGHIELMVGTDDFTVQDYVLNGRKVPLHRLVPDPVSKQLVDIWDLPKNLGVFADVSTGKTETVFQFSTPSAVQWLKQFNYKRPDGEPGVNSIEAMAAFTALDRPGPLNYMVTNPDAPSQKHNLLVEYARRVRGLPGSADILPVFDSLLPETYGLIVFQEGLQKVYQNLTGCTGAEAEEFRRLSAKKLPEKMAALYTSFIEKASLKIGKEAAQQVWTGLLEFSAYSFNCIEGDQLIKTEGGSKKIKDLTPEDKVACVSGSKRQNFHNPINVWQSGEKEVFEVTLEDGTTIRATEDHTFLYNGAWVSLRELILLGEVEQMKPRMKCQCGQEVSRNTIQRHVNSRRCRATDVWKDKVKEVCVLLKQYPLAWPKKNGKEALGDPTWWFSVLQGTTALEDWNLHTPRERYCARPSVLKKYSNERTGIGNPMVRAAPHYDEETLRNAVREEFSKLGTEYSTSQQVVAAVENKYPMFQYSLCVELPKDQRASQLYSWAMGVPLKEGRAALVKKRGRRISAGQKSSPRFIQFASRHAAELSSGWRISKAQKRLFTTIRLVDPDAAMEKKVCVNGRTFSYDVYSPKFNALIEMHGDFWHRPLLKPIKSIRVTKMIERNLRNDPVKQKFAVDSGYRFVVFWESEEGQWKQQLKGFIDGIQ